MGDLEIKNVESPFKVYDQDEFWTNVEVLCPLNIYLKKNRSKFEDAGYTKFTCVESILIGGTSAFPPNNILYTANALASLLDPEADGTVDFELGEKGLLQNLLMYWINGGETQQAEWSGNHILDYNYGLELWKLKGSSNQDELKAKCFEKAFLLVYQHGYAKMWPETFGWKDEKDFSSSTVCKEVARLQCVKPGWWHPDNQECPEEPSQIGSNPNTPLPGTCNKPICECSEFFYQSLMLSIDQKPSWLSPNMPTTKDEVLKMLDPDLQKVITSTRYAFPKVPFNGTYNGPGGPSLTTGAIGRTHSFKWPLISASLFLAA